jgi:hypothetical protein
MTPAAEIERGGNRNAYRAPLFQRHAGNRVLRLVFGHPWPQTVSEREGLDTRSSEMSAVLERP